MYTITGSRRGDITEEEEGGDDDDDDEVEVVVEVVVVVVGVGRHMFNFRQSSEGGGTSLGSPVGGRGSPSRKRKKEKTGGEIGEETYHIIGAVSALMIS
jgi:hypothetical protein